jgi:tetratricopeptide (TPR) repeat protein
MFVAIAVLALGACSRPGPGSPPSSAAPATAEQTAPVTVPPPGNVRIASAAVGAEEPAPPLPTHLVSSKKKVDRIQTQVMDALWAASDDWFHLGDYDRSVADMRVITAAEPTFVEGYCSGGNLLESLGRHKDAETYLKQGAAANPNSSKMYYMLGMFYFHFMQNYPAALAAYEKDVTLPSADVNDWKMLGHTYEKMHKMDKAAETWKKIYARWPDGPSVKVNYDRIMRQVNAGAGEHK